MKVRACGVQNVQILQGEVENQVKVYRSVGLFWINRCYHQST